MKKTSTLRMSEWGLLYNDQGEFLRVNANALVERYVQEHPTAVIDGKKFMTYTPNGVWRPTTEYHIKRELRQIVHGFEKYSWDPKLDRSVTIALPLECIQFETLKDSTGYINVTNGLLNLDTFELEPHTPKVGSTVQIACAYDPNAQCPQFLKAIEQMFLGDNDLKRRLQQAMGYSFNPGTQAQAFIVLWSDGSSGKSLTLSLLSRLHGGDEQVGSVTLGNLGHRFQRAQLFSTSINISSENDVRDFDTEPVKAITAGDPVQIEPKGEKPFTARLNTKLWFATNALPAPRNAGFAVDRRLVLIPYLARFVSHPDPNNPRECLKDPELEERLVGELPGILVWALDGLRDLIKNNYTFATSQKVDEYLLEYKRDHQPVFDFVVECCTGGEAEQRLSTDQLYHAYRQWAVRNGINYKPAKRGFLKELRGALAQSKIAFTESKSGNERYFKGVSLTPDNTLHTAEDENDVDADLV